MTNDAGCILIFFMNSPGIRNTWEHIFWFCPIHDFPFDVCWHRSQPATGWTTNVHGILTWFMICSGMSFTPFWSIACSVRWWWIVYYYYYCYYIFIVIILIAPIYSSVFLGCIQIPGLFEMGYMLRSDIRWLRTSLFNHFSSSPFLLKFHCLMVTFQFFGSTPKFAGQISPVLVVASRPNTIAVNYL